MLRLAEKSKDVKPLKCRLDANCYMLRDNVIVYRTVVTIEIRAIALEGFGIIRAHHVGTSDALSIPVPCNKNVSEWLDQGY